MSFVDSYPQSEKSKYSQLQSLFTTWKNFLSNNLPEGYAKDDFVSDGFFPYFTSQKKKILFLGRESIGTSGKNYLEFLKDDLYPKGINGYSFHYLMFYIAYGLNHNAAAWQNIPYADDLMKSFCKDDGISFAVMNLSKLANECGEWEANNPVITKFVEESQKSNVNFFDREIEIINPDIVVGMNLPACGFDYTKLFSKCKWIDHIEDDVGIYEITINNEKKILLDTFHFSAPGKSPEKDIYIPICKALKKAQL